jgi:hypothetical protein
MTKNLVSTSKGLSLVNTSGMDAHYRRFTIELGVAEQGGSGVMEYM